MRLFSNHSFELSNLSSDSFNYIVQYLAGQYNVGTILHQIIDKDIHSYWVFFQKVDTTSDKVFYFDSDLLAAYLAAIPFCHLIECCHLFILIDHKPLCGVFDSFNP